ncbi:hydrolase [Anopheles sinensis]|uniref:Hydrolase n=1 Tax=Anopheles sinensis TaxID=74873 RepID=A0A084VIC6_ANOSI|nr:hydrolase [Anopheles sinensis]
MQKAVRSSHQNQNNLPKTRHERNIIAPNDNMPAFGSERAPDASEAHGSGANAKSRRVSVVFRALVRVAVELENKRNKYFVRECFSLDPERPTFAVKLGA